MNLNPWDARAPVPGLGDNLATPLPDKATSPTRPYAGAPPPPPRPHCTQLQLQHKYSSPTYGSCIQFKYINSTIATTQLPLKKYTKAPPPDPPPCNF